MFTTRLCMSRISIRTSGKRFCMYATRFCMSRTLIRTSRKRLWTSATSISTCKHSVQTCKSFMQTLQHCIHALTGRLDTSGSRCIFYKLLSTISPVSRDKPGRAAISSRAVFIRSRRCSSYCFQRVRGDTIRAAT